MSRLGRLYQENQAFLRDVEACFVAGALAALALNLCLLPDSIRTLSPYLGVSGAWRSAIFNLSYSLLFGGLEGLIFILPVLRGRPYLKALCLAVLLTFSAKVFHPDGLVADILDGLIVSYAYGFVTLALPWTVGTAFLLHMVFKARV